MFLVVQNTSDSQPDTDDVDETTEDDIDKFVDQLCCVRILGRLIPENTISMVTR